MHGRTWSDREFGQMASAAAARRSSATGQFIERFALMADRISGYRLADYASSSGFVKQSASPFDGFGAVVAAGSKPLPIGHSLKEAAMFTVEEARERLSAFIDGRYVPDSIADLIEYLGERFMRLETRIAAGGRIANYLVDTRSHQAVPAALVDPKLSHSALLGDQLRSTLRKQIGKDAPAAAFDSWQGMMLVLDDVPGGTGYTVSGGVAWYGKIHAVATADREKNLAIVREARSRGIELVLPKRQDGPMSNLVTGMPILVRSKSMKASAVHPGLDHDTLVSEFSRRSPDRKRLGMIETFGRLDERSRAMPSDSGREPSVAPSAGRRTDGRSGNVIFLESFHKSYVRPANAEMAEDNSLGFGGLGGALGERDLVLRRSAAEDGQFYVFDRDLSEEVPIAPNSLPAGRYARETSDGIKEGFTDVGRGGGLRHLDLDGQAMTFRRKTVQQQDHKDSPESSLPTYRR